MKNLLFLPLLIPLVTAVAGLFCWNRVQTQRMLSLCGTTALTVAGGMLLMTVRQSGVQAVQAGNWAAPFGITLVADLFSAIMVFMAGIISFAVTLYGLAAKVRDQEHTGYHPLSQVLLLGVCGSVLTGDLFNLFVWFEVMLIASFVLMALGGRRSQMEGAVKYVVMNLVASAVFLSAVGIIYGVAGTLNMADLSRILRYGQHTGPIPVVAMLFFCAFAIKAAVFPFFFWLPASYHTVPIGIITLFSALLTKVGVYALIRLFTLVFYQELESWRTLVLGIAGMTMVTGVLGAVAQHEIRRLLSFHIVSQIGYLIMGLGLLTELALTGTIFFMVHVILAKSALFLAAGLIRRSGGSTGLAELGGLVRKGPLLPIIFILPALAMAGIPPLSGFWAKLALVWAGLETERYVVVAAALAVSILTLFSMIKIWSEAFWKEDPGTVAGHAGHIIGDERGRLRWLAAGLLVVPLLLTGFMPEPFMAVCREAAGQLLDPSYYIAAVLGGGP